MTPSGGVRTHDKFRIAANRAEVLFADFILEHLNPNGRAGFIVPEGIIFQNNNDYVSLRKWLINEAGLWAVVSLPAQIFQPYSGVKTSVILVDRALARQRNDILLVKVENDGFSLNTNRTSIPENDLPAALQLLTAAKRSDYATQLSTLNSQLPLTHRLIPRADFARLDAYKATTAAWDFCRKFRTRADRLQKAAAEAQASGDHDEEEKAQKTLAKVREDFPGATGLSKLPDSEAELRTAFDASIKAPATTYGQDAKEPGHLTPNLREALDAEREFSLNLDSHVQAEHQSPAPEFPRIRLNDVCCLITDGTHLKPEYTESGYKFLSAKNVVTGRIDWTDAKYVDQRQHLALSKRAKPQRNDILLAKNGTTGVAALNDTDEEFDIYVSLALLRPSELILPQFLVCLINSGLVKSQFNERLKGIGVPNLHLKEIREVQIPLPPLEQQRLILVEVEGYQRVVDGCVAVLDSYRPTFTPSPDWPRRRIGDVCQLINGRPFKPEDWEPPGKGALPIIRIQNLNDHTADFNYYSKPVPEKLIVKAGDLLFSWSGSRGTSFGPHIWTRDNGILNQHIFKVLHPPEINRFFLYLVPEYAVAEVEENLHGGVGLVHITKGKLSRIEIAIPSRDIQDQVATEAKRDLETLEGLAGLKAKFEAKIAARLAAVWEEVPTTERPAKSKKIKDSKPHLVPA